MPKVVGRMWPTCLQMFATPPMFVQNFYANHRAENCRWTQRVCTQGAENIAPPYFVIAPPSLMYSRGRLREFTVFNLLKNVILVAIHPWQKWQIIPLGNYVLILISCWCAQFAKREGEREGERARERARHTDKIQHVERKNTGRKKPSCAPRAHIKPTQLIIRPHSNLSMPPPPKGCVHARTHPYSTLRRCRLARVARSTGKQARTRQR